MNKKLFSVLVALVLALVAGQAQAAEENLLKSAWTAKLPAIIHFEGDKAFTKANGIMWTGENFQKFILPKVEEGVEATTLTVSELTRAAKDIRIASTLNVDERGEVSLAHFFHLLQVQDRSQNSPLQTYQLANVAYIVGTDDNTWAVTARLLSDGWYVSANPLGSGYKWDAGDRFVSR